MPIKLKRMKIEKFKVLLYLKMSRLDKSGKAPIMGRITTHYRQSFDGAVQLQNFLYFRLMEST